MTTTSRTRCRRKSSGSVFGTNILVLIWAVRTILVVPHQCFVTGGLAFVVPFLVATHHSSTYQKEDSYFRIHANANGPDDPFFPAEENSTTPPAEHHYRARVAGVSVSPTGFWFMLQHDGGREDQFLPIQVTDRDQGDVIVATSAPALTLLQLLAGLDLAGTVLPPEVLAQVVVVACEEEQKDDDEEERNGEPTTTSTTAEMRQISSWVERAVQKAWDRHVVPNSNNHDPPSNRAETEPEQPSCWRYTDQTAWLQSRVRLPEVRLDEVFVIVPPVAARADHTNYSFELQCTVVLDDDSNHGISIRVILSDAVLQDICYEYRPQVSQSFIALALALRYKAPITVVVVAHPNNDNNNINNNSTTSSRSLTRSELRTRFPAYRGADEVLQPADRSVAVLERGLEIHQLQAAWQLARQRGDDTAATKIRLALDELDRQSLNELPVQADTDLESMQ